MICLIEPYIHKCLRLMSRIKLKHVCIAFGIILLLDLFGAFTHIFEISYHDDFSYPYVGDIQSSVDAMKNKKMPNIQPIYQYNYSYIYDIKDNCIDNDYHTLRIIFLVKSSCENFNRRNAIRNSWGHKKRFFDVPTRTIFLLGRHTNDNELQIKIDDELKIYNDIVQADFIDSYYNNTIKTMIGFKWIINNCLNAKFYMFVDDDMYVSVKNVLRFIRNPASYPDYLREPSRIGTFKREIHDYDVPNLIKLPNSNNTDNIKTIDNEKYNNIYYKLNRINDNNIREQSIIKRKMNNMTFNNETVNMSIMNINITDNSNDTYKNIEKLKLYNDIIMDKLNNSLIKKLIRYRRQVFDFELPDDVRLFAGYVFNSSPHRHKTSKWYVSLNEYPYDLWPPYVTAGSYILSKEALIDMYYTSFYTKYFRFDDIYLGLVAKKAEIEPFHCDEFHFYKKDYTKFNYKYVITSHGYENPNELLNVWNEQKSLGNA